MCSHTDLNSIAGNNMLILPLSRWRLKSKQLTSWPIDQLTSWPTDQLTNWPTDQLTNWPVDQLTSWPIDQLTNTFTLPPIWLSILVYAIPCCALDWCALPAYHEHNNTSTCSGSGCQAPDLAVEHLGILRTRALECTSCSAIWISHITVCLKQ